MYEHLTLKRRLTRYICVQTLDFEKAVDSVYIYIYTYICINTCIYIYVNGSYRFVARDLYDKSVDQHSTRRYEQHIPGLHESHVYEWEGHPHVLVQCQSRIDFVST